MSQTPEHFEDLSLLELFRVEAENQVAILTTGLLELERDPTAAQQLEALMRAAHSLKGAARIVNLPVFSRVAHAMENCFVAAQKGNICIGKNETDVLLRGVDFFTQIAGAKEADFARWETSRAAEAEELIATLGKLLADQVKTGPDTPAETETAATARITEPPLPPKSDRRGGEVPDRVVRVAVETVNRLLGLAGESLVESRRLQPLTVSMQRLKRLQSELATALDHLRQLLTEQELSERARSQLDKVFAHVGECREFLAGRIEELNTLDRRTTRFTHRLYNEALQCRMRPFGDGVRQFPRMVRDLARSLGKEARLEIRGENTQVDRDILERLDAPLNHLLRNAVDHGCESPDERRRRNKSPECVVLLEARHSAGWLLVTVADDGRGIDPETLREAVARKKLAPPPLAGKLTAPELLDFLFLPGFTLKESVTEISGRGVGLDVVREMVKSMRGKIHVVAHPDKGMRFQLQLPITLSVVRALLVEVAGESYAIPMAQIVHTLKLPAREIQWLEGHQYFAYGSEQVGLVSARRVLEAGEPQGTEPEYPVVVLGDRGSRYGLMVDRFLGQRELVVQLIDARLGKIRDINSAAILEDGSPVLILDVEDMVLSIEKLVSVGLLSDLQVRTHDVAAKPFKRVLVVEDSPTVREVERKLLAGHGHAVDVAVDGMDGWNAVRAGDYDLVVTDVDMPRMDGLELTALIRRDPRLKALPVLMVSHKEREEDRQRGLEAGANFYLTKSGFQDEVLLELVGRLLGESWK